MRALVEVLLREPPTLSQGMRELIASSVSRWNDCRFCRTSHGAASGLGCGLKLIDIKVGLQQYAASPKL
jgi:alkylhydroperoxidase family enzyme